MTRPDSRRATSTVAVVAVTIALAAGVLCALAQVAPALTPASRFGLEVDRTSSADVCTVASHHQCQPAGQSSGAGSSYYPVSVAADPETGNLYVADIAGDRIQELTAAGAFVSMFGWDVNETKDRQAVAGQAERNLCTAASGDVCAMGVAGASAGQLDLPSSVAADAGTGDLYVLQSGPEDFRVDKYTRDGRFVWRIGKGVNLTTKGNLCSEREIERAGARCGAGAASASESTEHGAFKSTAQSGNLLAVGGPGRLLYVGDEHRVQVFGTDGRWKREILLVSLSAEQQSSVAALALDPAGELYVVYRVGAIETYLSSEHANIVHKLDPAGNQVAEYPVLASHPKVLDSITGMALDGSGRLAVIGIEAGVDSSWRFGLLFHAATGALTGEFTAPPDNEGVAFNGEEDLYVTTDIGKVVVAYAPSPAMELVTSPTPCEVGIGHDSPLAFDCGLSVALSRAEEPGGVTTRTPPRPL